MISPIFADDFPRDPQFKIYKNLRIHPSYVFLDFSSKIETKKQNEKSSEFILWSYYMDSIMIYIMISPAYKIYKSELQRYHSFGPNVPYSSHRTVQS